MISVPFRLAALFELTTINVLLFKRANKINKSSFLQKQETVSTSVWLAPEQRPGRGPLRPRRPRSPTPALSAAGRGAGTVRAQRPCSWGGGLPAPSTGRKRSRPRPTPSRAQAGRAHGPPRPEHRPEELAAPRRPEHRPEVLAVPPRAQAGSARGPASSTGRKCSRPPLRAIQSTSRKCSRPGPRTGRKRLRSRPRAQAGSAPVLCDSRVLWLASPGYPRQARPQRCRLSDHGNATVAGGQGRRGSPADG